VYEQAMQTWDGERAKAQRIGEGKIGTELGPEARTFCNQRHAVYIGSLDPTTGEVWASVVFADPAAPGSIPQLAVEIENGRKLPRLTPQELPPDLESELSTVSRRTHAEPLSTRDIVRNYFCDSCGVFSASSSAMGTFQASAYKQLVQCPSGSEIFVLRPPTKGDPLWKAASMAGSLVSLTFLEFETRRRLRTNGVISKTASSTGFSVTVAEVFTTCPRYIQRRTIGAVHAPLAEQQQSLPQESNAALPADLVDFVTAADTFFLATVNPETIRGCDISHRGGRPGFVRVIGNGHHLVWGDYHGKGMVSVKMLLKANLEPKFPPPIPLSLTQ